MEGGQTLLVKTDFALDDEIWLEPAIGHTPGHVVVHLASKGEEAVMCGDLMHSPVQCAHPEWSAIFDWDQANARVTRHHFLETQCADNRLVLTAHFPSSTVRTVAANTRATTSVTSLPSTASNAA
jgi:glyoxylase-like metal-dependent hydrolase (beta-lactamase superfamily II)